MEKELQESGFDPDYEKKFKEYLQRWSKPLAQPLYTVVCKCLGRELPSTESELEKLLRLIVAEWKSFERDYPPLLRRIAHRLSEPKNIRYCSWGQEPGAENVRWRLENLMQLACILQQADLGNLIFERYRLFLPKIKPYLNSSARGLLGSMASMNLFDLCDMMLRQPPDDDEQWTTRAFNFLCENMTRYGEKSAETFQIASYALYRFQWREEKLSSAQLVQLYAARGRSGAAQKCSYVEEDAEMIDDEIAVWPESAKKREALIATYLIRSFIADGDRHGAVIAYEGLLRYSESNKLLIEFAEHLPSFLKEKMVESCVSLTQAPPAFSLKNCGTAPDWNWAYVPGDTMDEKRAALADALVRTARSYWKQHWIDKLRFLQQAAQLGGLSEKKVKILQVGLFLDAGQSATAVLLLRELLRNESALDTQTIQRVRTTLGILVLFGVGCKPDSNEAEILLQSHVDATPGIIKMAHKLMLSFESQHKKLTPLHHLPLRIERWKASIQVDRTGKTLQHGNCFQCRKSHWRDEVPVKYRCPCGTSYYCGRECQQKHWSGLHKNQCSARKKKKTGP